jgi:tetratricopeptide (TPR) repeat protein
MLMFRSIFTVVAFALIGFLSGCASTPAPTWAITGDALVDGQSAISQGPAKDRVLWQYRTALVALRRGQFDEARKLLDDALASIEVIPANDKEAKRSRGYFSEEARKSFRGEPYERVMAYYYRGILYWMDDEPDNARACFRSAQLQDSDTENKEYASDYVLLDYLDGLATVKLDGDGSDSFKRAQAVSKIGPLPPYSRSANALFFLEFGKGPTKYAAGEYSEQLRIQPGSSAVRAARIRIGELVIRLNPMDDLNFQATTRGGRVMDHILANKAVFKSATDAVGNAALISGMVVGQNQKHQEAALGLLAFGLVSKIVSATTTPQADTRAWDNLPQYLGFAAVALPPGAHTAVVEFLDAAGKPISSLNKTVTVNVVPRRDTVAFVSDRSHTSKTL